MERTGVISQCPECGKEIYRKPYRVKKNKNNFCSMICSYAYRKKQKSYNVCGEDHGNWKGGKKLTDEGYFEIYQPHHPRASKQSGQSAYVREHILVAEKQLGRFLREGETVHHINFDKTNNAPENLYLFLTAGEHTAYHHALNRGEAQELISNIIQKQ
jgi:hypothetical protein